MWRVSLNSRNRCFSLSSRSVRPIPAQQFPPFPCWAMAAVALGFQVCHLWARVSPTPELHCSQWWNPGAVQFGGRWRTLSHSATGNPCLSVMQARSAVYFHVSLETQRSLPCSTTLPGTSKSHSSSCITKLVTGNCETGSACVLRGLHARGDAGQVL